MKTHNMLFGILIIIFAALSYIQIQNMKYESFAQCFQNMLAQPETTTNDISIGNWFELCDVIMTHKIGATFAPMDVSY